MCHGMNSLFAVYGVVIMDASHKLCCYVILVFIRKFYFNYRNGKIGVIVVDCMNNDMKEKGVCDSYDHV